jgi:hypothetical protein
MGIEQRPTQNPKTIFTKTSCWKAHRGLQRHDAAIPPIAIEEVLNLVLEHLKWAPPLDDQDQEPD